MGTAPFTNFVEWELPANTRSIVAYTEVWFNTVDDRETAQLAGIGYKTFVHTVEPMSVTYYWVRSISFSGVEGFWNAVTGVEAISPKDPQSLLDLLNGELGESVLTADLNARISTAGQFVQENFNHNNINNFTTVWDETVIGGTSLSIENVPGAPNGEYALQAGDNTGSDDIMWRGMDRAFSMALNPGDVYRMSAWVRRTAGSAPLYVGVNGYKGDVRNGLGSLVSTGGADTYQDPYFFAADAYDPPDNNWQYVEGYFAQGNAYAFNAGTLDDPHILHPDVEYVAPVIVLNYSSGTSGTGTTQIKDIRLERVGGVETTTALNKYVVKVDSNGYVAGYGLLVDPNDGEPTSEFQVAVDKFFIRSPGATSLSFAVVNGEVVMDAAFIKDATIDNAKIKDATIRDAKIAELSADKLTAGTIDASIIDVTKLNASRITTGSLDANRISLNGNYMDTDSLGRLILQTGGVDTSILAYNAATVAAYARSATKYIPGGSHLSDVTVQQVVISGVTTEADVRVDFTALFDRITGDYPIFIFSFYRNGTLIYGGGSGTSAIGLIGHTDVNLRRFPLALTCTDSPPAGNHTYYFKIRTWRSGQSYNFYEPTILLTHIKR